MLELCSKLEDVADHIPASVYCGKAAELVNLAGKALHRHIFLHESCLFPIIRDCGDAANAAEAALRQFEFEHASEQGLIVEISETLTQAAANGARLNAECLGHLLRNFFEGYKRHAMWECLILFPIVRMPYIGEALQLRSDVLTRLELYSRTCGCLPN